MADSKIEWTKKVWNPVTGCTPISEGCEHCYAKRMSHRLKGRYGYPADNPFRVTFHPDKLLLPLTWKKPRRIFVNSMGDLFHPDVKLHHINSVFLTMLHADWHTYQILTKRPERMLDFVTIGTGWRHEMKHVWLGVTVENDQHYDRIETLLKIPAAVRFVSFEPLLSVINFPLHYHSHGIQGHKKINWVIAGCETGPGARVMKSEWAVDLWEQCDRAGIPYFFKKESPGDPCPEHIKVREFPK